MSDDADLTAFIAERDEMLRALDVERAREFHHKWNEADPRFDAFDDEHVLVSLHKARTGATTLTDAERQHSIDWLTERGFHHFSDQPQDTKHG